MKEDFVIILIGAAITGILYALIIMSVNSHYDQAFETKLEKIYREGKIRQGPLLYRSIKRFWDLYISVMILVALLPILFVCAVAIKWSGKGKIFRYHECVGHKGTIVRYRKFNVVGRDGGLTKVGRVIMLFELNRIPMLISVVTGGFTLLGLTRIKVGRISGEYLSYFDYEKPGILSLSKTGKMKPYGSKIADGIYLKARGFLFDIRCLSYIMRNTQISTGEEYIE